MLKLFWVGSCEEAAGLDPFEAGPVSHPDFLCPSDNLERCYEVAIDELSSGTSKSRPPTKY